MRLSDLLHSSVYDASGECLGSVHDVRLVQDGPPLPGGDAALRVDALVVGRGAMGLRLGYVRTATKGPWLLKVIFRRLARRARYVEWSQVAEHGEGRVTLRPGADVESLGDAAARHAAENPAAS
ncbi:MAG: PRC-barrel domain containing protein [Actinobacteria bacterium]|nr:PRC-barrel domain containing protein [Actinomycetota bacterium]